jgi:hypothetical protein
VTSAPTLDLEALHLDEGSHANPEDGMCVMEAVAYVAGEPFSDHPECASPILGSFLRSWNDGLPDADRQMLKPYIPRLIGTNTGPAAEQTRAWMLTDWLARECAPGFLRLAGLADQATLLEGLAPILSTESATVAGPALKSAQKDANAAWAAAWDPAWDAARDAARAAAWDAARDAARAAARAAAWDAARDAARAAAWDAAWDAARDAAWDAARAAAWDAAWDAARDAAEKGGDYDVQYAAAKAVAAPLIEEKFGDTVKALQASALLLLDRMIDVGSPVAA